MTPLFSLDVPHESSFLLNEDASKDLDIFDLLVEDVYVISED